MKLLSDHKTDSKKNHSTQRNIILSITIVEGTTTKKMSYTKNQEIIDDLINNLSDIASFSYNIHEYSLSEIIDTLDHSITLVKSIPKKLYKNIASELKNKIYIDEKIYEDEKIIGIDELLEEYEIDITSKKEYLEFLKDCMAEWKIGRMSDKRKNTPTSS